MKKLLVNLKKFVLSRPSLTSFLISTLQPFPQLRAWLGRIGSRPERSSILFVVEGSEQLPLKARKIYNDLKIEIQRNGKI